MSLAHTFSLNTCATVIGFSFSPILFYLWSEYLIKEALESSGNLKIGLLICTMKCADDLVLLAKEEMLLHGMI
jgi:hypothetical protein